MCEQEELAMKNENWRETMLRALYVLMVGAFCFCLGILAGCDGSAGSGAGQETFAANQPQALLCKVPSPTYDMSAMPENGVAVAGVLVSNPGDAAKLCEAWTVVIPAGVNGAGFPYSASCKLVSASGVDSPECGVKMTTSVCSDVANDFLDSAGGRHCFHAGGTGCDFSTLASSFGDGKARATCTLGSLGLMKTVADGAAPTTTDNRMVELCSADGTFVGWMCPDDAID
jgi:hypothetical protein